MHANVPGMQGECASIALGTSADANFLSPNGRRCAPIARFPEIRPRDVSLSAGNLARDNQLDQIDDCRFPRALESGLLCHSLFDFHVGNFGAGKWAERNAGRRFGQNLGQRRVLERFFE